MWPRPGGLSSLSERELLISAFPTVTKSAYLCPRQHVGYVENVDRVQDRWANPGKVSLHLSLNHNNNEVYLFCPNVCAKKRSQMASRDAMRDA